jgi:NAD(P)-dependent dehydrogenase (short-subunit alcohol dehydrogenase family)
LHAIRSFDFSQIFAQRARHLGGFGYLLPRNAAFTAGVCCDDGTVDRKAFTLHKSDVDALLDNAYGQLVVTFGQTNYAAAKAGVIGFTKALAVELARSNITVNAVAIGAMATEMWDTVPDAIKETIYEKIPMHRACTTEEAARGVRFLAVEGAYITGHALNMNGGLYQG